MARTSDFVVPAGTSSTGTAHELLVAAPLVDGIGVRGDPPELGLGR